MYGGDGGDGGDGLLVLLCMCVSVAAPVKPICIFVACLSQHVFDWYWDLILIHHCVKTGYKPNWPNQ